MDRKYTGLVVHPGTLSDGRLMTKDEPYLRLVVGSPLVGEVPMPQSKVMDHFVKTQDYRHAVLMHREHGYQFWVPVERDEAWLFETLVSRYHK